MDLRPLLINILSAGFHTLRELVSDGRIADALKIENQLLESAVLGDYLEDPNVKVIHESLDSLIDEGQVSMRSRRIGRYNQIPAYGLRLIGDNQMLTLYKLQCINNKKLSIYCLNIDPDLHIGKCKNWFLLDSFEVDQINPNEKLQALLIEIRINGFFKSTQTNDSILKEREI